MKVTDQLNRTVVIPHIPERIVSLVPSQTELLVDLGLGDKIVGVTKFCIHPKGLKQDKTIIGGTKNFNFEKIEQLNPDLIIGNKEENYKEGIEKLEQDYPVWMSDIYTFDGALDMIRRLGVVLNCEERCEQLISQLQFLFGELESIGKDKSVLYFIWKEPDYLAGDETFIGSLLEEIGFKNACETSRYPALEELTSVTTDYVFLSSEPFPFSDKHSAYYQSLFPNARILLVDGEMFSWYGPRMLEAADYFKSHLKPQL